MEQHRAERASRNIGNPDPTFEEAKIQDIFAEVGDLNDKIVKGLPDSGARRTFETGSVRDIRTGKGRYDLISPIAMASLAKRLEDGMQKYGERNWEKGQPLMSYLDSTIRHINDFILDKMKGRKSVEDHISAAFWNLHAFIHTSHMIKDSELPAELDDLPQRFINV